jgi:AraC family transcriptional regulator
MDTLLPLPFNRLREPSRIGAQHFARWAGLSFGWFDARDGARSRAVHVEQPMLALLESGRAQATFSAGGRSQELDLSAGAMGLFTPEQPSHDSWWRCRDARRIIVDIDLARIAPQAADAGLFWRHLKPGLEIHDPELAALLRAMADEVAAGCPLGTLYAESLSLGLVLRLWQQHTQGSPERERGRLGAAPLARVEALIEAGLGSPITLAAMAGAAGFSKAQFVRLFRNTLGCSPHAYVLARRVERARVLVERTALPLAQVAADVGFSGQSHLNLAFGRRLGTTPGRLRREARARSR